jgi:hypothetical protein
MQDILENTIVLIDPCLNPDGHQRFSSWVNSHRSKNPVGDPNNRENTEPWPGGRTNHYWFDLNRDWLPARHPESKARVALFHQWKPNIQTDHHEMGGESTFFFQPGEASRIHPLIPEQNRSLTRQIGQYYAQALDEQKVLYFTHERFDDFYFGKGSTYPDIQGSVGILFEQASPRGYVRETSNGLLTFHYTIKNQFVVSLATLRAGLDLRPALLEHQRSFFREAVEAGKKDAFAYLLDAKEGPGRSEVLAELLLSHGIHIRRLREDVAIDGVQYRASSAVVVPLEQSQYWLIRALFDRRTSFADSIFYDISAWDLDLSMNMHLAKVQESEVSTDSWQPIALDMVGCDRPGRYAYAMPWSQEHAPAVLYKVLDQEIRVRVAQAPFTDLQGHRYDRGTLVVSLDLQERAPDRIYSVLDSLGKTYGVAIYALHGGTSSSGISIGSDQMDVLERPGILLLVGEGVRSYEAGEIWHLMDYLHDIPVSLVPVEDLGGVDLARYNTVVMPGGQYSTLRQTVAEKLNRWVREGGTLIAMQQAQQWLYGSGMASFSMKNDSTTSQPQLSYAQSSQYRSARKVTGAILEALIDRTHPLAYGYFADRVPVFKNNTAAIQQKAGITMDPVRFAPDPLLSGYMPSDIITHIAGTPAVSVAQHGGGRIIFFNFNPNFRGIWYGTNRMFLNAVFFGRSITTY